MHKNLSKRQQPVVENLQHTLDQAKAIAAAISDNAIEEQIPIPVNTLVSLSDELFRIRAYLETANEISVPFSKTFMTSIKDLKSDHKNARKRTDRSATLIEESLKKYGAARSIVIDEDNRVLAGNGTIEGAKAAGLENVRVIETDGDEIIAVKRKGLTEDQKVGLALADNRASDLSAWDASMLHELGKEHDLSPWFETEDLVELMGDRNDPTVPQDFPEVDDELETEHRCPSCGYEWSGKTK